MASLTSISQSQFLFNKPQFTKSQPLNFASCSLPKNPPRLSFQSVKFSMMPLNPRGVVVVSATTAAEKSRRRYPEEAKGFVEEMRFVAMKLHTREQAKEGEKEKT